MARSSSGCAQPAEHARHHRIGAVLLDVAVGALVDEARLGVVTVFARPAGEQVVVERRAAGVAAVGRLPFEKDAHRIHGFQFVGPDRGDHLVVAVVGALAQRLLAGRGVVALANGAGEQRLHQAGAGAAGTRSLGVGTHILQREQSDLVMDLTMSPLHTPLQPQISAESGRAMTRVSSPCPASPRSCWPNRMLLRKSAMLVPSRISWKYQLPSMVSP